MKGLQSAVAILQPSAFMGSNLNQWTLLLPAQSTLGVKCCICVRLYLPEQLAGVKKYFLVGRELMRRFILSVHWIGCLLIFTIAAQALVERLHSVLRPFLLRRLKRDVEKQLPGKHEHIIKCRLSKRQRTLYEDYMAASDVRNTLSSGNFLGIINVLMQLRKVIPLQATDSLHGHSSILRMRTSSWGEPLQRF